MKDLYLKLIICLITLIILLPNLNKFIFNKLLNNNEQNNQLKLTKNDMEKIKKNNMNQKLQKVLNETKNEIRKAEEEVITSTTKYINPNRGPDLSIKEEFHDEEILLYLFFTHSCPHSQLFLPTWYRIKNRCPSNIKVDEINCLDSSKKYLCSNFDIKGVPTVIIVKGNQNIEYTGDRSEEDLIKFLKLNGISLNIDEHEGFVNFNTNQLQAKMDAKQAELSGEELDCPIVTFDKRLDRVNNVYSFQIFDENGLYGYSKGGTGQPLDSFHAAYNCFDTYLSTLPSEDIMEKCANKYKGQIMDFELCNEDKLNEMLEYDDNIKNGNMKQRVEDVDYKSNQKVINTIKKACSIE